MTQFTTDPIETLPEWNAVLASGGVGYVHCCCEMPECPVPTTECEEKTAEQDAVGWTIGSYRLFFGIFPYPPYQINEPTIGCVDWGKRYSNVSYSLVYSSTDPEKEGFTEEGTLTVLPDAEFGAGGYVPSTETGTMGVGTGVNNYAAGVLSGTVIDEFDTGDEIFYDTYVTTFTFSNTITFAAVFAKMQTKLEAVTTWTAVNSCSAELVSFFYTCNNVPTDQVTRIRASKRRFRWVIPDTFPGSYFKISWDILAEPDGWDDPSPSVFRSLTPGVPWEWTGPGDPAVPGSWKSGWYDIDPPTTPGTRRVVNRRCECYRGPFGSRPEFFGETIATADL